MAAGDPLERVLNLVAEGRVSAEEAASILAALDDATARMNAGTAATGRARPDEPPGGSGSNPRPAFGEGIADGLPVGGGAASLRLEVREGGRQVVNLRLPLAVGRLALDRVPGLSGDQVERAREALSSGMRGPILEVNDGDNVVRIVLE